ncbi:hypothetical protein [Microcystis phage Mwe-JY26]
MLSNSDLFPVIPAGAVLVPSYPVKMWLNRVRTIHAPNYFATSVEAALAFAREHGFDRARPWVKHIEATLVDGDGVETVHKLSFAD